MAAPLCGVSVQIAQFLGRNPLSSVLLNSKRFVRALRRKPVAVLYPGETESPQDKRREDTPRSSSTIHAAGVPDSGPRSPGSGYPSVRDQLGGLRYDKAKPGDQRLAKVVSIARSRAFREQQGKVLLEGRRLISDALAAGAAPQMLFFSRVERLRELPLDKLRQASLVKVKFEDIKIWSDLVAPQGVIAIFSKPDASCISFPKAQRLQTVPLFLICDNVRDPGNLGTILRGAAAAGCDRVLLSKGCVDAWEPKVLRAAMGAHFRVPVFPGLDWNDISEHLPKQVTVHVADNYKNLRMKRDKGAVFQDNEKPGDAGFTCKENDSHNTHLEEYIESDTDEDDSDDEVSLPRLELKAYHENWAQRSTALVINGETYGASSDALQLAGKTSGNKLFVPMAPGVECLNAAMIASILLFEGRRQLLMLPTKSRRRARSVIVQ